MKSDILQPRAMRLLIPLLLVTALHAAPRLIAHRGASAAAPENTMAAFNLAWEQGADGIEGDFFLSQDGRIVCIHDKETKRVAEKNLIVAATPWSELRKLDVGSWKSPKFAGERIPLLEEVLTALPDGKFFFVEIKCGPEIVGPLASVLEGADPQRVILISFNPHVVKACREKVPDFQAHLVSALDKIGEPGGIEKQRFQLKSIDATGLQFNFKAKVDASFISCLHADGRLTACWTVNDAPTAARIAALGVDFITTDQPALLRRETMWP